MSLQLSGCIILGVSIYLRVSKDGNLVRVSVYLNECNFCLHLNLKTLLFVPFFTLIGVFHPLNLYKSSPTPQKKHRHFEMLTSVLRNQLSVSQ